jgi:two-component system, sensor histidine kinase PdtaS
VFGESAVHVPFQADREPNHFSSAPVSRDELRYRLRQQSLLGEFGRIAMQTRDFRKILQRATELCSSGLQAPFVKVLEYEPDEKRLMVRAGVGWAPDTIDTVSLAADIGSPAGYAYQTGESVISNHLKADKCRRTVVRLLQTVRSASDAHDNRIAM